MREIKHRKLTPETFARYGSYANMIDPDVYRFGKPPIEFYRDMVPMSFQPNGHIMFSVCRVEKRENIINVSEYHNYSAEGLMPLDGDILMHVGPANGGGVPPLDEIEVFYVPKNTFVCLNIGVWHHAGYTFNTDSVNMLICLPERTYETDCYVTEFAEKDYIKII